MSRKHWIVFEPKEWSCGHVEEHGGSICDSDPICWKCMRMFEQANAIPCVGCGGFDPRPMWRGEFNSPRGYWGGGWCPECYQPLPATCMHCMGQARGTHECGKPLERNPGADKQLAFILKHYSMGYYSLRHMLGARDWPGHSSDYEDLPDVQSLWSSFEEARDAVIPWLEKWEQEERAKPEQMALFG